MGVYKKVNNVLRKVDDGGGGGGHTIYDIDDKAATQESGLKFAYGTIEDDEENSMTVYTPPVITQDNAQLMFYVDGDGILHVVYDDGL